MEITISIEEIEKNLDKVIDFFFQNDRELLTYNTKDPKISERCISFRLGIYLQDLYKEYNVDCEYNRHGSGIKTKNGIDLIYPDIIVHKRKSDSQNLLIIEIKKDSSNRTEIEEDKERLKYMTKEDYKYKYGVLLIIANTKKDSKIIFFIDGKEV